MIASADRVEPVQTRARTHARAPARMSTLVCIRQPKGPKPPILCTLPQPSETALPSKHTSARSILTSDKHVRNHARA